MRDPTDQFDLPDHRTWQMNFAVDHRDVGRHAKVRRARCVDRASYAGTL